ncbi:peptidylprolyl isomerase domain and WD repeat-containing protein 1-like [Watersipora subatra]|uniref:peptidylprolyl isomerase domain and WD repeat-containing protein 1-like n=1 Tax=Watersipora subatra TaxID=2589382 RepID=UPI00355B4FF0
MEESRKRKDAPEDDSEEVQVGPMPPKPEAPAKANKVLAYEHVYLNKLPSSSTYEKSFMHRDVITHCIGTRSNFLITASAEGCVKFWKKTSDEGLVFVKLFRAHLERIVDMIGSAGGELCCTVSEDKTLKVFDVTNFDMINMLRLGFTPHSACWLFSPGDAIEAVAVSEQSSPKIYVYDCRSLSDPTHVLDRMHFSPVSLIRYNGRYDAAVSVDVGGQVMLWAGPKQDYKMPKSLSFDSIMDTDLLTYMTNKDEVLDMSFSPNGKKMAVLSSDRKVRLFNFLSGKIVKVIDESLQQYTELQQTTPQVPVMEFGRRLALERELAKSDKMSYCNLVWDDSGYFLLYATLLGIKVVNLHTNKVSLVLGKTENIRFLHLVLLQGTVTKQPGSSVEMQASDNPILNSDQNDPMLFCTGYKKNRFYIFSRRDALDTGSVDMDRDICNEKPTKEELVSQTQETTATHLANTAVIYTSMGDIHLKLFPKECPKTVENFTVHCRNSYYNQHVFHRIIKGFMIQTGDPEGNGTGGDSIWGREFEDEFHPTLRHDRPYTLSMANAGPNTNGSQFFITLAPTPWLDNKHTVFGRVVKGMEIVNKIGAVKTHPKTDKPTEDVTVINIKAK